MRVGEGKRGGGEEAACSVERSSLMTTVAYVGDGWLS
jgi:hypothetical protein